MGILERVFFYLFLGVIILGFRESQSPLYSFFLWYLPVFTIEQSCLVCFVYNSCWHVPKTSIDKNGNTRINIGSIKDLNVILTTLSYRVICFPDTYSVQKKWNNQFNLVSMLIECCLSQASLPMWWIQIEFKRVYKSSVRRDYFRLVLPAFLLFIFYSLTTFFFLKSTPWHFPISGRYIPHFVRLKKKDSSLARPFSSSVAIFCPVLQWRFLHLGMVISTS